MLTFEQMALRFVVALVLGALLGWEREIIHKDAGIRTAMLVAGGASIFAMVGLTLPYLLTSPTGILEGANGALGAVANIVIGIGFLGAGLIVRDGEHVRSITTAAVVWTVAAVGTLAGIGLLQMAIFCGVSLTILLYALRNLHLYQPKPEKPGKGLKSRRGA